MAAAPAPTSATPKGDVLDGDPSLATAHARSGPATSGERTGPSTGASVMLDIGDGRGALVIYTTEVLAGAEIEIRPSGGPWAGLHTAVRVRHMADRVLHAGVFGSLPAGPYDLRLRPEAHGHGHGNGHGHGHEEDDHDHAQQSATVESGAVVEVTLMETKNTSA